MKYITIIKVNIKNNFAYNWSIVFNTIVTIISVIIPVCLWKALYVNNIEKCIYMINYSIMAQLLASFYSLQSSNKLCGSIRSGVIAYEMIRPIDYIVRLFFEDIGYIVVKLISVVLPMIIVSKLFFNLYVPSITAIIMFLFSIFLSIIILFLIRIIVSMICFWAIEAWSLIILLDIVISFFSGRFLPGWIMPESIQAVMNYLPFIWIYQKPIQVYLAEIGEFTGSSESFVYSLTIQLVWIFILYAVQHFLWSKAVKKLVIQGG